ncbi:galactokinase [Bavariicoccus seileri]|uniref:galactokinase n=1 Tax=Bavariicoccus seileri TaxID=549685 RepID=UPI003F91A3E6
MSIKEQLDKTYQKLTKAGHISRSQSDTQSTNYYFAPGRINLIGEHTDYNGGNVFPCAISFGTYALFRKREDDLVTVYSENFPAKGVITFSLSDLDYDKADNWANYPKGMVKYLTEAAKPLSSGFDMVVYGNIPNGAGLSSSASIELLTGVAINDAYDLGVDRIQLIKLGQKVENDFIGVNSGIMDQFAVGMGQKDTAILLDCHTLDYELVPIKLKYYCIIIMNTNKRRELADSKYNERRSECEEALKRLQTKLSISSLGDLDIPTFEANRDLIHDDILEKRAKHAVYENQRTLKAKDALKKNDLTAFGQLMDESHDSLKNDYEVTGKELDTLVAVARRQPGVLGARMTGAGFGGCAIALVKEANTADFEAKVGEAYQDEIGYEATFYPAHIETGAKKLDW